MNYVTIRIDLCTHFLVDLQEYGISFGHASKHVPSDVFHFITIGSISDLCHFIHGTIVIQR